MSPQRSESLTSCQFEAALGFHRNLHVTYTQSKAGYVISICLQCKSHNKKLLTKAQCHDCQSLQQLIYPSPVQTLLPL